MIVTREWLQEWVDLEGIDTDEICRKLNAIGLEVDSLQRIRIPEKIVVGYVVSCEKHPDADKLSVCQIDLGTATRQIVCGAANIAAGQYVPVATVGAVMPNGMKIEHAKLRGVESDGMVCSAEELGLPSLGKGILVLDDSIGALEVGRELARYEKLNDDVIEIELTANRGDCLSIHGVARELAVAFDRPMQERQNRVSESGQGIGSIFHFAHKGNPPVSLLYRVVDAERLEASLLMRLRLAWVDEAAEEGIDTFLRYAMHGSGVVLRAYGFSKIGDGERAEVTLEAASNGLGVLEAKGEEIGVVGVRQRKETRPDARERRILLEASYVAPDIIAPAVKKENLESDDLYYRTSRGSEPDLDFGMDELLTLLSRSAETTLYAGSCGFRHERETLTLDLGLEDVEALVGVPIAMAKIVSILTQLGFRVKSSDEERVVFEVPAFRHDILNRQDVIEEIVRIVGIDNIPAAPMRFLEANRVTEDLARYRFIRDLRLKAVANGFFETVHYIFCDNALVKELGFTPLSPDKALLNPITNEMDGLRPSLMVTMLDSLKRNVAMSKRRVPLFEVGRVFDSERRERFHLLLVHTGEKEPPSIGNQGKPGPIDFWSFATRLSAVVGPFELEGSEPQNGLMHPYQTAAILIDGKRVGTLSKLHPSVAESFDLPDTYFAEFDLPALAARHVRSEAISAYTPIQRDLSLLIPKTVRYQDVRAALAGALPETVERFFAVDLYDDESLGEKMSLTLRFVIASKEKTLEEREINDVMAAILQRLEKELGATLR